MLTICSINCNMSRKKRVVLQWQNYFSYWRKFFFFLIFIITFFKQQKSCHANVFTASRSLKMDSFSVKADEKHCHAQTETEDNCEKCSNTNNIFPQQTNTLYV